MNIVNANDSLPEIGYQEENGRTQVRFDLSDIATEYPGGSAMLLLQRPGDKDIYASERTELDGNTLVWNVEAWALAKKGFLKAQVVWTMGQIVAKTKVYRCHISDSLMTIEEEDAGKAIDLITQYVLQAEGITRGTQNGEPVGAGSPYYEDNARYYHQQAGAAAEMASTKEGQATSAAMDAINAKNNAQEAAEAAVVAKNKAQTQANNASASAINASAYAANAQSAMQRAEAAAVHAPMIGSNGHWYIWDQSTSAYADSGMLANVAIHICSASEYDAATRIPTIQNPDAGIFYLVPSTDQVSHDLFAEWIYTNGAWEMFGSAAVDLTDYVQKTDTATGNTAGVVMIEGTPTENSAKAITSGGVYAALAGKQNTLTFDSAPTEDSTNPVTSGGVYDAISEIGRPTDEQVAEAVSDWLDEHPEATTTVQDGSITKAKLVAALAELVDEIPDTINDAEYDEEDGITFTKVNGETITVPVTGGGADLSSLHWDWDPETGYLHMYNEDDEDVIEPTWIGGGGGGGGGGSLLTFSVYTDPSFSVLRSLGHAEIEYKFTSLDRETETPTGPGTMTVNVGGVARANLTIQQGDHRTIDVFSYLAMGSNTVQLKITDSYGNTATRVFTITVENFSLSWNLGNTEITSDEMTVTVTPTGNGSKEIVLLLDGDEVGSETVTTSGRPVSFELTDIEEGVHLLEATATMTVSGTEIEAEPLYSALLYADENPQVAALFTPTSVTQMTTFSIPYRVVDPENNPATVSFYINGTLYDTASVNQSEQIFTYRPTTAGTLEIEIECGTASWTKTLTVTPIDDEIQEVTRNLIFKFDPSTITDLANWSYNGVTLTLSANFDTHNGGLIQDEENVRCVRVKKGDRMVINHQLFGRDHKTSGAEFKIIYTVNNSVDMDAQAIHCMNGGIGLDIRANRFTVTSESTEMNYMTCEDIKTEFDCVIDPIGSAQDALMMLWESGTPTQVKTYPRGDRFVQTTPVGITIGSDDCDVTVYLIRVYSSNLIRQEIQSNFEADGKNAAEMEARYQRNNIYDASGNNIDPDKLAAANPGIRVITWHANNVSASKETKIVGTLTHKYIQGGARHSWTATAVTQKAQGTSSLQYGDAGCNEDFDCKNGFVLEDGTEIDKYAMTDDSVPVSYFNYKTNVASQEHVNNIAIAEWFNRYQPSKSAARIADERLRDTIEGHMCAMFFHNTGTSTVQVGPLSVEPDQTVLYSLGCLNNSKKNSEVFDENSEHDVYGIEVRDNTSLQERFKSDDLSAEDWSGDMNFEFRYLDDSVPQSTAVANFQQFLTWVVSCDATQAPNTALNPPVVIDGTTYTIDNATYRKAKYKAEAADWMNMDTILYHQVFTLMLSMVDNRAKNTFWYWNAVEERWHLRKGYDFDTAMGIDNQGELRLDYGFIDTDTSGSSYVFNGHDQVVFAMNRECFATELRNMYISLESAGCFNMTAFADYCDELQSIVPEVLWTEDAWRKDIDTYNTLGATLYLTMLNGKKRTQRRRFLKFQRNFIGSYFDDAYSRNDNILMRGYAPENATVVTPSNQMTITPYCHLYATVIVNSSSVYKVRTTAGVPVTVIFNDMGTEMNNTPVMVCNASMVQSMGSIANLYPGSVDISHASKLRRLEVGSSLEGYENTNMTAISTGNAPSLEYLNLEGCTALTQALNLSGNPMLKDVYIRNTGVQGVTFAQYGKLETAYLNAIRNLTAKDLYLVETFNLASPASLATVNVERSPGIDTLGLIEASEDLARVRLIDVNWTAQLRQYGGIMLAAEAMGIDDSGADTAHAVITGRLYFAGIGQTKYTALTTALPDVIVSYGELLAEYSVTFVDVNGTTLYVAMAESGTGVADPVEAGLIPAPTKPATVSETYTFFRWNANLTNITANMTVEPLFTATQRYYTVRYIDRDPAGLTPDVILQEETIIHHGHTRYNGNDLTRTGYVWVGWSDSADEVVSDMDITADYITPLLPATPKDMTDYDYAYSDDPNDSSAYTFAELYAIIKSGSVRQYMGGGLTNGEVGQLVKFKMDTDVITDLEIVFSVHSIGHYKFADENRMSNCDFYMVGVLNGPRQMNGSATNAGGWHSSQLRNWLNSTMYPALPPKLRNLIVSSITLGNVGSQSLNITESTDKLRLLSRAEVGLNMQDVPYVNEVDQNANEIGFVLYTDSESRLKRYYNGAGAVSAWWTRSPEAASMTSFTSIATTGATSATGTATYTFGICFGFSA